MSVWLGKIICGVDLRNYGSKSTGATNSFRVLGTEIGIFVLIFDILKGIIIPITGSLLNYKFSNVEILWLGLYAVIGHIFPIFCGLRGGKGVSTIFGLFCFLSPFGSLLALGCFLITLLSAKMVSLSSIIASISLPIFCYLTHPSEPLFYVSGIFVPILIILTHKKNIKRIILNEEPKINLDFF